MNDNRNNGGNAPIIKIVVPVLVVAVIFGIWAYKNLLPDGGTEEKKHVRIYP